MKGTYKYDDLIVVDPTVELIKKTITFNGEPAVVELYMYDDNDGATFEVSDKDEAVKIPSSDVEPSTQNWVENYLKKYKQ